VVPRDSAARQPRVLAAGGEWTAGLLMVEGLGIICRQWGARLSSSTITQVPIPISYSFTRKFCFNMGS
jgi:hypothetical protein